MATGAASSAAARRNLVTFDEANIVYKLDNLGNHGCRSGSESDMANPTEGTKGTMGFLADEFPALSSNARAFVRHHPREARLAVAVALEAAAAQLGTEDADAAAEVPEGLRPFVVRRSGGEDILGVSEAAKRLKVSRTTVYDWVDRKTLIAWKSTKRGLNIPAAQILGAGKVVAGLADVVEAIGDPELAWAFLSQEWPFEDIAAAPLMLLKAGRIDDVLGAAAGFGATFA
ncbi:MAG: helix-turn-helix domain-containing protein [Rhodospirillaceae bacterium]|nr:helix-turn-helix domain-containing protein [Rhodospirillaceae bacterium]MYF85294.1 helix-turn-helix domain-containing protein [Rhodospirillaceae bacterium]MYH35334.1 helix-turn-helix domain-containing protein [Rhodospirillaceae bacterium]MYK16004.1 helix-turn-helix domain-containing protein [Rhodospirillaceae bacterium]MYK59212.1 helix-turn-helix domain-containing protein [Rhodospirillaceae bacterium]